MIKLLTAHNKKAAALAISLSLAGCTRFDTRMQANGDFDYQHVQLVPAYQSGPFSTEQARSQFAVPVLTEGQKSGYLNGDVDIRPPTQFIPLIDGVLPAASQQQTTIWFNGVAEHDDMQSKVWRLLESYLAANNIAVAAKNDSLQQIETAVHTQKERYGDFISHNEVLRKASYRFTVEKQAGGYGAALNVALLSYAEYNDGQPLKFKLSDKSKRNIELRLVNSLLAFAYNEKQAEEQHKLDAQPLAIKLGFDANHQTAWLVDNGFEVTWRKLPSLLSLLHFEIIEADQNLGYYLVRFSAPGNDYWQENNLNPFTLKNAQYVIQLGEMAKDSTSISWLDKNKQPLADQQVTDIYLSITDRVRDVLLKKDKQTKAL